ncbi:uncharacterized protein DUF1194 [Hoeflea halophila]|uniref:Uncharacterized protein DUF1194 n=2 Tax=Hoeflea halophila TaxID=714899 RepID=A0A286HQ24_9HYPH|nr:uncharacterized protein DUF1194 [Hoeflea halophila]
MVAALVLASEARGQEPVDVALVLAVDVSRSMAPSELSIQREGYAAALNHPDVVRAIRQGAYGRIAVTMFEWAGNGSIRAVFDWTLVENATDAEALSAAVLDTSPVGLHRTSISGAILHALKLLDEAPFDGFRKVIDISGDGPNNQGRPVLEAREMALNRHIVINGLPLMTSDGFDGGFNIPDLDVYYAECVIGGPGSFLVPVTSWDQFPEAIRRKLILEIGGLPAIEAEVVPAQAAPAPRVRASTNSYNCLIGEKIWQQRQWMFDDP